ARLVSVHARRRPGDSRLGSGSPRHARRRSAPADHSARARVRRDVAGSHEDSGERDAALRHRAAERAVILDALARGIGKRCPHCGRGALFSGWAHHLERCTVCGLVYERNAGDTWAFTIIGDRIPVAIMVALVYFGLGRNPPLAGLAVFAGLAGLLVLTAPN